MDLNLHRQVCGILRAQCKWHNQWPIATMRVCNVPVLCKWIHCWWLLARHWFVPPQYTERTIKQLVLVCGFGTFASGAQNIYDRSDEEQARPVFMHTLNFARITHFEGIQKENVLTWVQWYSSAVRLLKIAVRELLVLIISHKYTYILWRCFK